MDSSNGSGLQTASCRYSTGQAGSQASTDSGFAELMATPEQNQPFVSHSMVGAERGARGIIKVSP